MHRDGSATALRSESRLAWTLDLANPWTVQINILSFYSSTLFQNAARPVDGDINKFLPIWTKIKWFNFCQRSPAVVAAPPLTVLHRLRLCQFRLYAPGL